MEKRNKAVIRSRTTCRHQSYWKTRPHPTTCQQQARYGIAIVVDIHSSQFLDKTVLFYDVEFLQLLEEKGGRTVVNNKEFSVGEMFVVHGSFGPSCNLFLLPQQQQQLQITSSTHHHHHNRKKKKHRPMPTNCTSLLSKTQKKPLLLLK